MIAGSGVSTHPRARDATGEVVGQILERVGDRPELTVRFVAGHDDDLAEIATAVRTMLSPAVLVGSTARTVAGGAREFEGSPAIALLALRTPGCRAVRIGTRQVERGTRLDGLDPSVLASSHSLLLISDPFSFPTAAVLDHLGRRHGHLTVVGGMTSASRRPGGNRLLLDDAIESDGAVAVAFGPGVQLDAVVSPACRPIGEPFTVTEADGPRVRGLGGRPATERLRDLLADLPPHDRSLAATGLHAGRVVDEQRESFGPGDFVVRNIRGIDRADGSVVVGEHLPVGSIFQFQLRDPDAARSDLVERLAGRRADAGVLFTCDGRGSNLFGERDHDAALVDELLDGAPLVGMSCSAEIGPGRSGSQLHGYTASLALLSEPAAADADPSVVSEA